MRTNQPGATGGGPRPSRRAFLRAGGLGALGATWAASARPALGSSAGGDGAVILLLLAGGPSQLDTFDPKPDAPAEIRGPSRSIPTSVPGVRLAEPLPELARRMDRLTLIRSLCQDALPNHEAGFQLVQTGGVGHDRPHVGSVAARRLGARGGVPPFVTIPGPIGRAGFELNHGQTAGPLGASFGPFDLGVDPGSPAYDPREVSRRAATFLDEAVELNASADLDHRAFDIGAEPLANRDAYGPTEFGRGCLLARRLVGAGARVVVVNMYQGVFDQPTWDCHGRCPFATLDDVARLVLPTFDRVFCTLIDDLARHGLLDSTLVVATGEFGRTPRINASGGRDHHPSAFSAVLAGGGTSGGRVIGATDAHASEPIDRPVRPAELVATMYRALGVDPIPIINASPIAEAFA